MSAAASYTTIIARDFLALTGFYAHVFQFAEVPEFTNPAFRALDAGGILLTFTPEKTYTTLGIAEWAYPSGIAQYVTFAVDSDLEVEERTARAVDRGARLVREPYVTAYNSWQTVLADPENNIFRIHHIRGSA